MTSDRRPVVILASTGFILRDVAFGAFGSSVVAERPLVVAVHDPDDEDIRAAADALGASLIAFPRHGISTPAGRLGQIASVHHWVYRLGEARKSTESIQTQARLYEQRRSRSFKRVVQMQRRVAGFAHKIGIARPLESLYLWNLGRRPIYRSYWRDTFSELKPFAVVATMLTHSTLWAPNEDLGVALVAHEMGVPVGSLVQSWDNLTSKTALLPVWIDRHWTWSEAMSGQMRAMYPDVDVATIEVVGSPHFDLHRNQVPLQRSELAQKLGIDPDRPYVLVGTGTPSWSPDDHLVVLELARAARERLPELQMVVRTHPKDDPERWRVSRPELESLGVVFQLTAPNKHMDEGGFQDPEGFFRLQTSTISHASAVVNFASTLTVDAAILDTPVICIGWDARPDELFPEGRAMRYASSSHYAPLVETGGVRVARSVGEALDLTERYLSDPTIDRLERVRLVDEVAQFIGSGGQRLAAAVLAMQDLEDAE